MGLWEWETLRLWVRLRETEQVVDSETERVWVRLPEGVGERVKVGGVGLGLKVPVGLGVWLLDAVQVAVGGLRLGVVVSDTVGEALASAEPEPVMEDAVLLRRVRLQLVALGVGVYDVEAEREGEWVEVGLRDREGLREGLSVPDDENVRVGGRVREAVGVAVLEGVQEREAEVAVWEGVCVAGEGLREAVRERDGLAHDLDHDDVGVGVPLVEWDREEVRTGVAVGVTEVGVRVCVAGDAV